MIFPSTAYRDRPRPPVWAVWNESPSFSWLPVLSSPVPQLVFLLTTCKPEPGPELSDHGVAKASTTLR